MMAKENLAEMPENYDMMDEVRGNFVSKNTIYDILTNPFYYGERCCNDRFRRYV